MTTATILHKATDSSEELGFIAQLAQDFSDFDQFAIYADWLEEQGDATRAGFLRDYSAALGNGGELPEPGDLSQPWLTAIGYQIASAASDNGLIAERMTLLRYAKPALGFETSEFPEPLDGEDQFPVGATKRFGIPDLPADATWPRQKDCRNLYMPDSGIDPELPCSFVAQINCQDLEGTLLASYFPSAGLISIFSCSEIESIGMVDGYVTFSPDTSNLVRMSPPPEVMGDEADEANQLGTPEAFEFTESLEVPSANGESPFPDLQWNYDDDRSDKYDATIEAAGCDSLNSLGGFTTPTTGDDPLPGKEWCKLICIVNSIEICLHFCIRYDDLAAGNFDNVELAWVDFD